MTSVLIVAFFGTTALLWRPVLMGPGGGGQSPCPIPATGLTISVSRDPPFTEFENGKVKGILGEFFERTMKQCIIKAQECNLSEKYFRQKLFNSTTSFMSDIEENKTDIAFPVSAPMRMLLSGENYTGPSLEFVTFINSEEYSLIMDVGNVNQKANDIGFALLRANIWPIVVFTLLIAGISGIFIWILETYFNEEEFPRSFTKGSYEGFWWAFISMTTVGYGDKTPKHIFGRVFGVLWILLGLVVMAMFTANAISALTISATDLAILEGNKIGVLNFTSAKLEAKIKGAEVEEYSSIKSMFGALHSNEIRGILMDKYKAGYYLHENEQFRVFNSFSKDIPYYLAIRQSDKSNELMKDGSCFKEEIEKQDVGELLMNNLKSLTVYNSDSDFVSLFSGNAPQTHRFLLIFFGVFMGLVVLGILSDVLYWKVWKSRKKVNNCDDGIKLKEVTMNPTSMVTLKDVEDKLGQLIREVGKLQEQLTAMSSHSNGNIASG